MNKTQFDVLYRDVKLLVQEYLDKRKSKIWLLKMFMSIHAHEPSESIAKMIEQIVRKQAPEIADAWQLLSQSSRQKELMELCQRIKNERR